NLARKSLIRGAIEGDCKFYRLGLVVKKTLFTGVQELVTLAGAAKKQGRKILKEDLSVIPDGAMLVDGSGQIEWVGPRAEVSKLNLNSDVEQVELNCRTLLPAFIEC